MYRNCVYIPREECIRLFTWDENGNRITVDHSFNPYLYIEVTGEGEYKSLFNTNLRKKIFRTGYERYKYVQDCGNRRLFENIAPVHQFLIDRYWKDNDKSDFNKFPVRIVFLDIEYYVEGAFVGPDNPTQPINVITVYDSLTKCFKTWGTGGEFKPTREDSYYIKCNSEREMLNKFLEYLEHDAPDILTGWNTEFFDIPYLINRVAKVFGDEEIKRFSPTGNVYCRQIMGPFGRPVNKWYIEAVSCIDYLEIYKIFSQGQKESYKLNAIAEAEVGLKKVDYGNVDLGQLAREDWQKFTDYNIQDVHLLVKLEEKLQYLQLVRMLAYVGLTPFESALGTLTTVTGAAIIQARQQGMVVPTFETDTHDQGKIPGAFVAEPLTGFQENVVSFDLNSLYPNTMITLNLSPETKVGIIEEEQDNKVKIRHITGKEYNLSKESFSKFIQAENISVSKSGALFTQKKKGIFPLIVDKFYAIRLDVQKELDATLAKMYEIGKDHADYPTLKDKSEKLDIRQFTIKILINRIYGYFANKHAPLGDRDIAMSITLTGQATIKKSGQILVDWINQKSNKTEETGGLKRIVYNDTDSCYITLNPIAEALGVQFVQDDKPTQQFLDLASEITKHLNTEIRKWGEEDLNSKDCRFLFKRESICDVALFLQKKRYVLHILDMKGIPCSKFKYVGVEVVRSTLPKPIKPYVKKLIELMLLSRDQSKVNKLLCETYEVFKSLPLQDIAFVSGINKIEDYTARCNGIQTVKGMPHHAKAAYMHNYLLQELKLTSKYEIISSGDKIRYFHVKVPNKYRCKKIAFKYYYPEEFKTLFEVDYEKMFESMVYSILQRFYEAVKWNLRKPGEQMVTDLFELFKL